MQQWGKSIDAAWFSAVSHETGETYWYTVREGLRPSSLRSWRFVCWAWLASPLFSRASRAFLQLFFFLSPSKRHLRRLRASLLLCLWRKCIEKLSFLFYARLWFWLPLSHGSFYRPIPDREFVETYVKAFYLTENEMERWIREHKVIFGMILFNLSLREQ